MPTTRPATLRLPTWSAESSTGLVVDVGGTKLMVAAVRRGAIAAKRSFPISQFTRPGEMMDVIAESGERLCHESELPVDSAVVAIAGRLNRYEGTVIQAANLPFVDYPIADELSDRLNGASVRIEHDAACGLIGETVHGAARGCTNVIYLTISTGISVGILVDGAVLEGAHGAAGELGHTPVASPGTACPCGSSGCLEAYASGRALADLGHRVAADGTSPALAAVLAAHGEITAKDLLGAARQGDPVSVAIVDAAIGRLAPAVRVLLMTLDPQVLVIGGGVMSDSYFAELVMSRCRLPGDEPTRVRQAQLGVTSVMHGAMLFLGRDDREGDRRAGWTRSLTSQSCQPTSSVSS